MGWNRHPNTMTIAWSQSDADRSGHEGGTVGWLKSFREAYERRGRPGGMAGLDEYLTRLDGKIAEMERAMVSAP